MLEDNKTTKQQQFLGFKCNPTRVIQYGNLITISVFQWLSPAHHSIAYDIQ